MNIKCYVIWEAYQMLPTTYWPIRVQGIGEDMPSKTCFPLSTLNYLNFIEHTFWPSKPRLPKFSWWDSWAWIMSQKMKWCAMSLNHGLWWDNIAMGFGPWALASLWALLNFKVDFPKIHNNVDVVQVANEIKPYGVKKLSLTPTDPSKPLLTPTQRPPETS